MRRCLIAVLDYLDAHPLLEYLVFLALPWLTCAVYVVLGFVLWQIFAWCGFHMPFLVAVLMVIVVAGVVAFWPSGRAGGAR